MAESEEQENNGRSQTDAITFMSDLGLLKLSFDAFRFNKVENISLIFLILWFNVTLQRPVNNCKRKIGEMVKFPCFWLSLLVLDDILFCAGVKQGSL